MILFALFSFVVCRFVGEYFTEQANYYQIDSYNLVPVKAVTYSSVLNAILRPRVQCPLST
jgi:hypothetical protein